MQHGQHGYSGEHHHQHNGSSNTQGAATEVGQIIARIYKLSRTVQNPGMAYRHLSHIEALTYTLGKHLQLDLESGLGIGIQHVPVPTSVADPATPDDS